MVKTTLLKENKLTVICGKDRITYFFNQLKLKLGKEAFYVSSKREEGLFWLDDFRAFKSHFQYLMIEYPEQSLHPLKQVKLIRCLANLVNSKVKIILFTHSSTIIREINNLTMLYQCQNKPNFLSLLTKYQYHQTELLNPFNVKAYELNDNTLTELEIDKDEGIIAKDIDNTIKYLNNSSDEIYYSLIELD